MKRWIPGVAVLCVMTGAGALVGMALGSRFWPLFLSLALGGLAVVAWWARAGAPSKAAPTRRPRRPGRSDPDYDLETDASTDEQRWLM